MEVFISWSKAASKAVAQELRTWLPEVIQQIEPWMSEDDIDKGQRWNAAIAQRLNDCGEGIICVTRRNQSEAWLNFEAGALAKSLSDGRVRPVLVDLQKHELKGPLGDFQGTELHERDDMFALVRSLNDRCETPLKENILQRAFDRTWEEFQQAVKEAFSAIPMASEDDPSRQVDDVVAEILDRVRQIQRGLEPAATLGESAAIRDRLGELNRLVGQESANFTVLTERAVRRALLEEGSNPSQARRILMRLQRDAARWDQASSSALDDAAEENPNDAQSDDGGSV